MTEFRIQIAKDDSSGMYYATAKTDPEGVLIVRSEPIYRSEKDAHDGVKQMLQTGWPDRHPETVDPTIGV